MCLTEAERAELAAVGITDDGVEAEGPGVDPAELQAIPWEHDENA